MCYATLRGMDDRSLAPDALNGVSVNESPLTVVITLCDSGAMTNRYQAMTEERAGEISQGGDAMDQPRCSTHTTRETLPRLCHVCQRIAVEQEIVTRTVNALIAAGFALNINDGASERPKVATKVVADILAELMTGDDEYLMVYSDDGDGGGWVHFVYGNSGYDVISDYTTNLEAVIGPVMKYAETLS